MIPLGSITIPAPFPESSIRNSPERDSWGVSEISKRRLDVNLFCLEDVKKWLSLSGPERELIVG